MFHIQEEDLHSNETKSGTVYNSDSAQRDSLMKTPEADDIFNGVCNQIESLHMPEPFQVSIWQDAAEWPNHNHCAQPG